MPDLWQHHDMQLKLLISTALTVAFAAAAADAENDLLPFWKMECVGSGEPAVNGYLDSFNSETGKAIWVMTDKDGYQGTIEAQIQGRQIKIFSVAGNFNQSRTSFKIMDRECPQGLVGQGFR